MGAELKVLFELPGNFKKKIQDGFKGVIKVQEESPILKEQKKLLSINNKNINNLKNSINQLKGIQNKISKTSPGGNFRYNKMSEKILKQQEQLSKKTISSLKLQDTIEGSNVKGGKSGGKGGMAGLAVLMGGVIGLMMQLVQSSKSIQFILQVVGGLIDALVGPLVPILIGLIKPVFTVLMFLMGFMIKFFQDPVAALKDLFNGLIDGLKNLLGFGGKDKQKGAAKGLGAIAGAGIGFALGGPLGALIGSAIGPVILGWAADLGEWLGKIAGTFTLWINELTGGAIKEYIDGIVLFFKGMWDVFAGIFTLDWDQFKSGAINMINGLWKMLTATFSGSIKTLSIIGEWLWELFTNLWTKQINFLSNIGSWIYDTMTSILSSSLNVLSDIGSWIKNKIMKLWKGTKSFGTSLLNKGKSIIGMNDGIVSPNGRLVSVSPQDYIMAAKDPKKLMGGNSGSVVNNIYLTVNGNADRSMIEMIKRELRRELSSKGAF